MSRRSASPLVAYLASSAIIDGASVPEWVHLFPVGDVKWQRRDDFALRPGFVPKLCTFDGRDAVDRVPVDVNHSNAKLGPSGEPSPAVGWLVKLESRSDGLWGQVEWNDQGKAAIANRQYRGISGEFMVDPATRLVTGLRGASLTNHPNIKGLVPMFQSATDEPEDDKDAMDKILKDLIAKLGLKADATPDAVLQSVTQLVEGNGGLTAQLASIAKAAGVADGAKPEALLQSVTELAARNSTGGEADKVITELKASLQSVGTELNTLRQSVAKDKATAFVDGAIAEGRVGVKPLRDHYIEQHMQSATSAARVEKEIGAMPKLSGTQVLAEPAKDGELSAEEKAIARLQGVSEEAFKKSKLALAAAHG